MSARIRAPHVFWCTAIRRSLRSARRSFRHRQRASQPSVVVVHAESDARGYPLINPRRQASVGIERAVARNQFLASLGARHGAIRLNNPSRKISEWNKTAPKCAMNAKNSEYARYLCVFRKIAYRITSCGSTGNKCTEVSTESTAYYLCELLLRPCCRSSVWHGRTPAVGRVEFRHGQGYFSGLFAQIFLVDHAILANDERHDSRVPVFRGVGQNGEAAVIFPFTGHLAGGSDSNSR